VTFAVRSPEASYHGDVAYDLAIDLGTSRCRVATRSGGIVVDQASVVAIDGRTKSAVQIGAAAEAMIGSTTKPVRAVWPLVQGSIADYDTAVRLLRFLLRVAGGSRFGRPKVLLSVPRTATNIERRALGKAASEAGAARVRLLDQSVAAAVELSLPLDQPTGSMVCDLGAGKSEVAVLSMGGIVSSRGIRLGGVDLDDAIATYLRVTRGVVISRVVAGAVKAQLVTLLPGGDDLTVELAGRTIDQGLPTTVTITAGELRPTVDEFVRQIVGTVVQCLSEAPPEVAQDIIFHGIHLVGGGSLLHGFAHTLEVATAVPVHLHEDPAAIPVSGLQRCLELDARLEDLFTEV
jgi:rod shape-determining protein MreB